VLHIHFTAFKFWLLKRTASSLIRKLFGSIVGRGGWIREKKEEVVVVTD